MTCDAMALMWRHSNMWRNELYHIFPAIGVGGGLCMLEGNVFHFLNKILICTSPSHIENIDPFNDPSAHMASNAKNASIWWRHHAITFIRNGTHSTQAVYPGHMCGENWIVNPRPCFTEYVVFPGINIIFIKIWRPRDRLIFKIGIVILVKHRLHVEKAPCHLMV